MFRFVILSCAVFALGYGNTTEVSQSTIKFNKSNPDNALRILRTLNPRSILQNINLSTTNKALQAAARVKSQGGWISVCLGTKWSDIHAEGTGIGTHSGRFHSGPLPINTYIEGCTTPPCAMAQGQDAIINMEFATPGPVKSMTTYATIQLFVFQFPYDLLENSVTCNFLTNASCPVLEAQMLKYTLRLPIEDFMPAGTQVSTEFRVDDESNNTLVCLRVPILIAPPVV